MVIILHFQVMQKEIKIPNSAPRHLSDSINREDKGKRVTTEIIKYIAILNVDKQKTHALARMILVRTR